jgi:oligopeptide transport system substrate-binding protein
LVPLHQTTDKVLGSSDYSHHPSQVVTNGPFRLVEMNADGFRLEASPYYRDRAKVRLAGVQFIKTENQSTGALLVAAGKADLLSPLNYAHDLPHLTDRSVEVDSELVLGVVAAFFNVTRGPLGDVRVRQALALALDRKNMLTAMDQERLVPAWSWVPDVPGRKGLAIFIEDASEARRLLAAAGYPGGRGFPILRMALPLWMKGNSYPLACADRWFQELGIKVYVAYEAPMPLGERIKSGDYDVMYGQIIATVPDAADLLSTFTMAPQYSETKWHDDETIRLLAAANRKTGAERLVLVEQAERRAMAAVPAVPVMFERRHILRAAEVQGWYPDPVARQALKRLWFEPAPTMGSSPEMAPRL